MKELTRNWIITGIIFSVCVLFTVFCGLGIAHMRKDDVVPTTESSSEAPASSEKTPVSSSSEPESDDVVSSAEPIEPTSPSSDENRSTGTIRALSDEEIKVIQERYSDVPQYYSIAGERDSENRSVAAVNYHSTFSLKFKRVYVFNPQTRSDISLCFILTHEYGYTNAVLDILKENNIKATFFVDWSYMDNNSEIIERILLEKHELASLGASNPSDGIGLYGMTDVMNDLINLNNMAESIYDRPLTKLYFNHDSFRDQTVVLATQMGYEVIFYSAYYEDDDPSKSIDASAYLQSLQLQAHKGAIYRLHTANAAVVQVLPAFLSFLGSNGYTVGLID